MIKYTFYPVVNRNGLTVKGRRRKVMVLAMVMLTEESKDGKTVTFSNRVLIHIKRRRKF